MSEHLIVVYIVYIKCSKWSCQVHQCTIAETHCTYDLVIPCTLLCHYGPMRFNCIHHRAMLVILLWLSSNNIVVGMTLTLFRYILMELL